MAKQNRWSDIAYPFGSTLSEFVQPKDDLAVLRTSIINILLTRKGERVMRPEFGCGLPDMPFEPNDPTQVALIEQEVRDALEQDDRIVLLEFGHEIKDHELRLTMTFCPTGEEQNLRRRLSLSFGVSGSDINVLGL